MGPPPDREAYAAEFGARVRSQRRRLGWTQEGLAAAVDLHPTYVGSVERGQRNVSLKNIIRIATALSMDPGDLVAGLRLDGDSIGRP